MFNFFHHLITIFSNSLFLEIVRQRNATEIGSMTVASVKNTVIKTKIKIEIESIDVVEVKAEKGVIIVIDDPKILIVNREAVKDIVKRKKLAKKSVNVKRKRKENVKKKKKEIVKKN